MLISAEIRWFWQGDAPDNLRQWFMDEGVHKCGAGGGPPDREDIYLVEGDQTELGIKIRGKKGGTKDDNSTDCKNSSVEVKGLVAIDWGILTSGSIAGPVEIWCKWSFGPIDVGTTTKWKLTKTRWLRKFDTSGPYPIEIPLGSDEKPKDEDRFPCLPTLGCNIELTQVQLPSGDEWWSFGLEAFGNLSTVAGNLRAVAVELSKRDIGSDLSTGLLLSYPQWIHQLKQKR